MSVQISGPYIKHRSCRLVGFAKPELDTGSFIYSYVTTGPLQNLREKIYFSDSFNFLSVRDLVVLSNVER